MAATRTGSLLQLLLCSVAAHSLNTMDNILPLPTAMEFLDNLKSFDPCCLLAPPPPLLFPPPPSLWRRQSRVDSAESLPEGTGEKGEEEPSVSHCVPGCPGPPGPLGPQGPDGIPGPRGRKGDKGEIGRPGSKGRTGRPGLPGRPGPAGWPGASGLKGEKGDPGLMGMPGMRGPPGPKGMAGYKGEKGSRGDHGIPGPKGDKGTNGVPGMLGQKGEMGPKGKPGVSGKRGPTGRPGKRGKQGSKGETGSAGLMGPVGPPGGTGHPGPPGVPASGLFLVGEKGEKGTPGPPGHCDCSVPPTWSGPRSAPYTHRSNNVKVPAIFVVSNEEELVRLHTDNALAYRKDQKTLYFKDEGGWLPIQLTPLQTTEKVGDGDGGVCGDGEVQTLNGEECDDRNKIVTDDCVSCRRAYCGDGFRHEGVEQCDGKDFGYQTCRSYLPGSFGQLKCTDSCIIDSSGCKNFT